VEWTTLAATGLGAVVGVGSTLLADRVRWRRETGERDRRERRDLYVSCLTRYRLAYEDMHTAALAHRDGPAGRRDAAVRDAFRGSGCDEAHAGRPGAGRLRTPPPVTDAPACRLRTASPSRSR
jgi:hypothetical protein